MKYTTLSVAAVIVGIGLFLPTKVFAHGDPNDHAMHDQRRQVDRARHDAGIPWQQDRLIHKQERQDHRLQHNLNNGMSGSYNGGAYPSYNNSSAGYGNQSYYSNNGFSGLAGYGSGAGYGTGYSSTGYGAGYGNAYNGQGVYSSGYTGQGYYPANSMYGNSNGHTYSADGHRFDHHGNHDDGPGDQ